MSEERFSPEFRRDPITSEWVVLAAGRGKRPGAPEPAVTETQPEEQCPFCPGHEMETPPEISACREEEGRDCPGWTVRVFPNKFPILVSQVPGAGAEQSFSPDLKPALGTSEVIVDTPEHGEPPWMRGPAQVLDMLNTYRDRILAMKEEGRTAYVHIIRNHGLAAASSLPHPHSQLYGLPFIPSLIDMELDGFAQSRPGELSCILCDIVLKEIESGERLISLSENFIAFSPFASRLPYESWIVPRRHEMRFEECEHLPEMAEMMTGLLMRYHERLGDPAFNYWIHTYPLHGELRPFHWHLEILPRTTMLGGLEMGAGVWVNIVAPESAARLLRAVSPQ
ncbi:MAG: galactose-1-phosphate uridylyltransferase [Thermoleophilia bacterium]|nr:galactose-1-phosphate uridylyltransferase [Thermoleophilia bacterium]